GELSEPLGDGAHSLDVHEPVYFPAALARGPEFLGAWPTSGPTETDSLGKVRVFGGDLASGDRRAGLSERSDAWYGRAHDHAAPFDGGRTLRGALRDQCRPGGAFTQSPRNRSVEDRRRIRRDAEPAREPRLHLRDRHSNGDSVSPIFSRNRVS